MLFTSAHPQVGSVLLRELPVLRCSPLSQELDRREVQLLYREAGQREEQLERRECTWLAREWPTLSKAERTAVLELSGGEEASTSSACRETEGPLSLEELEHLVGVYRRNAFSNGLWLLLARVNHSCWPNSEVVWEGGGRRLVVLERVEVGGEVTHSYLHSLLGREARREELLSRWGFQCWCRLCSLTGRELEEQEELRREFTETEASWKARGRLEDLSSLLHLSTSILGFRPTDRLQLLESSYSMCSSRYLGLSASFSQSAHWQCRQGEELACLLYGQGSREALVWARRRAWPLTTALLGGLCRALAISWGLATLGALLCSFWQGQTSQFCALLLAVTLYSKSP